MKVRRLIRYSDNLLKGRLMKAFLVSLMPLSAELLFRLAEAAAYSLLLYFGDMTPLGLFTGESAVQQLAALVFTLWRWLTVAPLMYAAAYWFSGLSEGGERKSLTDIILSRSLCKKSLAALIWTKLAGVLLLVPVFLFGGAAYLLASEGAGSLSVLMTVHAFVMTVISLFLWLRAKLVMLAVPFVMVHFSEKSAFGAVRHSFRLMKGRTGTLLKLLGVYLPPMLTVIAVPFLLPRLYSAAALMIDIYIKEDEYFERDKADGKVGQASRASKLSAWKKRRITAASDKAEAAGYGNNP